VLGTNQRSDQLKRLLTVTISSQSNYEKTIKTVESTIHRDSDTISCTIDCNIVIIIRMLFRNNLMPTGTFADEHIQQNSISAFQSRAEARISVTNKS
jgi:hypothetical protein